MSIQKEQEETTMAAVLCHHLCLLLISASLQYKVHHLIKCLDTWSQLLKITLDTQCSQYLVFDLLYQMCSATYCSVIPV